MKHLKVAAATSILIASVMMLATFFYLRDAVQDYLFWNDYPYVESCMESFLTAQRFLSSYGLAILIGVLPAISLGTGVGWLVERFGKSQRRQVFTAIATAEVLTLLAVGFLSWLFAAAVLLRCVGSF